jgi:hypothetical protein
MPTTETDCPPEEFFKALEMERTQALVNQNMDTLERLHSPDYQLITPPGKVFDRERYLGAVAEAPFYSSWDAGEMSVRVSAEMTAVRYQARLGFPSGRTVVCWHTDIYEKRAGRWQAVWSQATEIR